MSYTFEVAGKVAVLTWEGRLTVEEAANFKEAMLGAMSTAEEIVLAFNGVEEADLTFFQILIASERSAQARGRKLRLDGEVPEPLLKAAEDMGFSTALMNPATTEGGNFDGEKNNGRR